MFNQIFGGRRQVPNVVVETELARREHTGERRPYKHEAWFRTYDSELNNSEAVYRLQMELYAVVRAQLNVELARIRRSQPRANPIFKGLLTLFNENSGKGSSLKFVNIDDLTDPTVLNDAIDEILQSNEDWTPEDMKLIWRYNPSQFAGGAAILPGAICPSNIDKKLWRNYDYRGPLPCAAVALAYYLAYYAYGTHASDRNRAVTKRVLVHARLIADTLDWEPFVSISDLAKFVEKFPQYRLTILNDRSGSFDYSETTWAGEEFDTEIDDPAAYDPPKNVIYLHLLGEHDHYLPVLHPGKQVRHKKYSRWSFCHHCCTGFLKNSKHACTTYKKPKACRYDCGLIHEKQSDCELTKCKTCGRIRKRAYSAEKHRCLPRDLRKPLELHTDATEDGKKYHAWAWDIESCLERETTEKIYSTYDTDSDGLYDPGTIVQVSQIRKHEPILVCAKNIVTGEKLTYYGSDCLERFLDMAISRNGGKNLFYAHNSSGYDSLLLFEACCKRQYNEVKVNPIFRGDKLLR